MCVLSSGVRPIGQFTATGSKCDADAVPAPCVPSRSAAWRSRFPSTAPGIFGPIGNQRLLYTHLEYLPFKPLEQGFGANTCAGARLPCFRTLRTEYSLTTSFPIPLVTRRPARWPFAAVPPGSFFWRLHGQAVPVVSSCGRSDCDYGPADGIAGRAATGCEPAASLTHQYAG